MTMKFLQTIDTSVCMFAYDVCTACDEAKQKLLVFPLREQQTESL